MFVKGELRLLWRFYLYRFIEHILGMAALLWTVYFAAKGFSYAEIGLGLAVLSAGTFLFEVPTGAVADIKGRRFSVSLGYAIVAVVSATAPFLSSLAALCALFLLWSVAMTLVSGADVAWVVDHLREHDREDLVGTFYARESSFMHAGVIIAGLTLTGLLMVFRDGPRFLAMDKVWFVQAAGMALVALIVITIPEHRERKIVTASSTFHFSKEGFRHVMGEKTLRPLFISSIFFSFSLATWSFAYQPFLVGAGLSIADLGWARSAASIGGIVAGLLAARLTKKENQFAVLGFLFILLMLIFVSVPLTGHVLQGFLFYLVISFIGYTIFPLEGALPHKFIPSEMRATIGSIKSMFESGGYILAPLIAGVLIDRSGTQPAILLAGAFLLPVIGIYFKLGRKRIRTS